MLSSAGLNMEAANLQLTGLSPGQDAKSVQNAAILPQLNSVSGRSLGFLKLLLVCSVPSVKEFGCCAPTAN